MIASIFYYNYYSFTRSKITYILVLVSFYFLYLQTFAVDLRFSNLPEFNGVAFTDGWINLPSYVKLLGLHFYGLLFILLVPVCNSTHSFFNSQILFYYSIKNKRRWKIIVNYVTVLVIVFSSIHFVYMALWNIYFFLASDTFYFLQSMYSVIYLIPQFVIISIVVVCFSILNRNSTSNLFFTYSYILIIPFAIWVSGILNSDISSFFDMIIQYRNYLFPYHMDIYTSAYDKSFSLASSYSPRDLLPSAFFMSCLAILFLRRKV